MSGQLFRKKWTKVIWFGRRPFTPLRPNILQWIPLLGLMKDFLTFTEVYRTIQMFSKQEILVTVRSLLSSWKWFFRKSKFYVARILISLFIHCHNIDSIMLAFDDIKNKFHYKFFFLPLRTWSLNTAQAVLKYKKLYCLIIGGTNNWSSLQF